MPVALTLLLAGWSFAGIGTATVPALAVLLGAELAAVAVAARLLRARRNGPMLAYGAHGNAGFWTVPVAAAAFGPRAAVIVAAYDLLTAPRLAFMVRWMRGRAPRSQSARTAVVDFAPMAAAAVGLCLGAALAAPAFADDAVAILGTTLAGVGAVLLGLAWPRERWIEARGRGCSCSGPS